MSKGRTHTGFRTRTPQAHSHRNRSGGTPPPARYPLDALWQAKPLFWVSVSGASVAAVLALAPGLDGDRWNYFGLALLVIQWISGLTLGALYVLRSALARLRPVGLAYAAALVLLVNVWIVGSAAWALMREFYPETDISWRETTIQLTGIVFAVALLGLAAFRNHWSARQLAVRAKQAELQALQARIRPHFLFNTLNTGAALARHSPEQTERLLLDLADLFRAALAGPRDISLDEELALVRRYLEIETLRFGERLRVRWDAPPATPDVLVPALSIQPLVENAIRHGIERVPHGGRVEIAVTTTAEHVVVRISNPLVMSDQRQPSGHHVGLNASQARIEALTGGRGSVQTGRQGEHWVATVRLPRRPASGDRRRRV